MSYTFHAQRDNAAGTLLYPFSPGDPTLRLNSGQGSPFGPVSSTTPIRVTVYHPASLVGGAVVDPTMTATFNVVSLAGDNLGGLTFQRGNSTLVFPVGSTVARVITQDDFAEIQGAVNDLAESGTAGVSISSPNGTLAVGGTASLPTLDVLAVPQSAVTGLTAALAGKLGTTGNGSGLTGITQSQVAGLHSDQSPTFAGATFTGAPSAPSYTISGATAASSFGTAVLDGRSVPVINADGSVNVGAFDSTGMALNGSGRPAVLGSALSVTTASPSHVGLTVNGAPSQTAELLRLRDSTGTILHKFGPDGRIYLGGNDLGGTFNFFAGGLRNLAQFQWQSASDGYTIVSATAGNAVEGSLYGYLASGSVSGRFFNRIQNTGAGDAVFDASAIGAGSAYSAYGKNGGQTWAVGYHQADGDSFKIGAYGLIGYDTVLKITPTGGTSLAALAAGTVPLTVIGAPASTADVHCWRNGVGSLTGGVTYNGVIYFGVASGDSGVGIECGTTNAAIQARGGGNPQLRANSTDGAVTKMQAVGNSFGLIGTESNHPLKVYVNNSPCVYIDTNGYVCVGSAVPGAKLDVYDSTLTNLQVRILNNKTDSTANTAELVFASRSGGVLFDRAKIAARSSNTGNYRTELDFQTIDAGTGAFTSRLAIDSDGHAGFGGAVKLAALSDAAAPNGSAFKGTDHSSKLCFKDDSGTVHVLY